MANQFPINNNSGNNNVNMPDINQRYKTLKQEVEKGIKRETVTLIVVA